MRLNPTEFCVGDIRHHRPQWGDSAKCFVGKHKYVGTRLDLVPYEMTHSGLQLIFWHFEAPGQNGSHFPDNIFKGIFLNESVWISIEISLKFVPKDPINNISVLVQIMASLRPDDKPLSETIMA